jgi:hypothetical protein
VLCPHSIDALCKGVITSRWFLLPNQFIMAISNNLMSELGQHKPFGKNNREAGGDSVYRYPVNHLVLKHGQTMTTTDV